MAEKNYAAKEAALLKKADAVLEVAQTHSSTLNHVPAFYDKIQLLREKRSQATVQSVVKHQATKNRQAVTGDTTATKEALAVVFGDALGHFKEYAKEEKDANLTNVLKELTISTVKKKKPLDVVIVLSSFVETAKDLKADRLVYHGLAADWVTTFETKVADYDSMIPKKESSKSNKPAETSNFKSIIGDIKDILTSLANLISGYKTVNPEFQASIALLLISVRKKRKSSNKTAKTKQLIAANGESKPKRKRKSTKSKKEEITAHDSPELNTLDSLVANA